MPIDHLAAALPDESAGQEQHNEDDLILKLLWRRKYVVAAFCAVGLLVGSVVAMFTADRYTSQVAMQTRFARPQLLPITVADAVIQTEISFIRSRDIAEDVVTRLGLANDPNTVEHPSMLGRARALITLITFWHSSPSSSATSRIAAELLNQLDVTNDPKSLVIRLSYTSTSPEQSSRIANAFAQAYIRSRAEKSAQQTLADLAATYGPKHPRVLKAQAQLEKVQAQLEDEKAQAQLGDALRSPIVSDSAQILAWASPPVSPSGPNRRLIVAVSFICSFAAGTILALLLERANTTFRSEAELAFRAKAPCLGIFAEDRTVFESARAIVMAAGLGTQSAQPKTLLVTSSVTKEGEILVSTAIAHSLVQMGRRVLLLDLSREAPKTSKSLTLEMVLDGIEHHALQLDEQLTVVQSAPEDQSLLTSRNFSMLLEQAGKKCDVVIIAAPPVMMSADAIYLGRQADFVFHVVRWNSTPRRVVLAALDRLRNFGIPVHGVILSRLHKSELERQLMDVRKGWKDWKSLGHRMKSAPIVEA